MSRIKALDQDVFWWINSHHSTFLDWFLWTFSQSWSWFIVVILFYVALTLRKDIKSWLWILVGLGLCILLADQISSNVIKDGIQRLRPCHEFEGVRMFHTGKGGLYGFVSSHAANAFAIAMFISLMYGKKQDGKRHPMIPILIFGWAIIVAYSRPYLGKHYPGDVICGALLGLGIGALVYFAICKIRLKISSRSSA